MFTGVFNVLSKSYRKQGGGGSRGYEKQDRLDGKGQIPGVSSSTSAVLLVHVCSASALSRWSARSLICLCSPKRSTGVFGRSLPNLVAERVALDGANRWPSRPPIEIPAPIAMQHSSRVSPLMKRGGFQRLGTQLTCQQRCLNL